jgi:hypothetical protein
MASGEGSLGEVVAAGSTSRRVRLYCVSLSPARKFMSGAPSSVAHADRSTVSKPLNIVTHGMVGNVRPSCEALCHMPATRQASRLRRVELVSFKAFERFSVSFNGSGYIVGPNNAGKSTIISAIRTGALMLRLAMRRNPVEVVRYREEEFRGFRIQSGQFALVDENLRHEFREQETRLVLHFDNNARVTAVWPIDDDQTSAGFFFLQTAGGWNPRSAADVRLAYPEIGVIPMLAPLEQQENMLDRDWVRRNQDGRLSSRHFRNQLLQSEELDEYLAYVAEWTPEIVVEPPRYTAGSEGASIDVFYRETGRRAEKELVWAGDGIQVTVPPSSSSGGIWAPHSVNQAIASSRVWKIRSIPSASGSANDANMRSRPYLSGSGPLTMATRTPIPCTFCARNSAVR